MISFAYQVQKSFQRFVGFFNRAEKRPVAFRWFSGNATRGKQVACLLLQILL